MNAGPAAVETAGLTKDYGLGRGIFDLDLRVEPGEVFGFLGPNGAGKTTTIRMLLDLIRPTRGRVEVLGRDPRRDGLEVRRRVGYLPGEFGFDERLTALEELAYLDALRGGGSMGRAHELAERLRLDLTKHISELSRGNKQKVALVQAFMHRPELLVLDEPSSGIDPLIQQEVRDLVREARDEGRTVFLSSHVLHEVQHLADRVGIVRGGRLVTVERVHAITALALRRVEAHFAHPVPAVAFDNVPGVRDVVTDATSLRCRMSGSFDPLLKALAPFEVTSLTVEEADLEEVFLTYYRNDAYRSDGDRNAAGNRSDDHDATGDGAPAAPPVVEARSAETAA